MACIGEGVRPHELRLHLMKELSGMPTSLKKVQPPLPPTVQPHTPSPERVDKASSSAVAVETDTDRMQE
ncbi:hypothetical protein SUGI_0772500 [Cryptomeria japonica]|nr:hypothetical protein SUGI_0772500 [Cryptomeria japonica]